MAHNINIDKETLDRIVNLVVEAIKNPREYIAPCPFCGGEADVSSGVYVACKTEVCGVGPTRPTALEAIKAWNAWETHTCAE